MRELKVAIGQLLVGVFFTILVFPILKNSIITLTTPVVNGDEATIKVSETLWYHRLPEIYFHAVFLVSSIIACMLIIRKPPRMRYKGEK